MTARVSLAHSVAACGLAEDLVALGLHSAAAIVRADLHEASPAIITDLMRLDTSAPAGSSAAYRARVACAIVPIVEAWARGDAASVNAAREAAEVCA